MKISQIKIGNRFRKDIGNLESLKDSIKEIGLLQPVVVDENNNLIAGYRRILACQELGKEDILVNAVNLKDVLRGEYDENTIRKEFTPTENVAIWEAIEKRTSRWDTPSDSDGVEPRQKAAKLTGLSTDTLSKIKQVVEFGNEKLIKEMDETGNVDRAYKQVRAERVKAETKDVPIPEGKYSVIYADPPWNIGSMILNKWESPLSDKYPTLTLEEIKNLTLPEMAKDCVCFLWATLTTLPDALGVLDSWGFKYYITLTWDKGNGWSMGGFHRKTEFVLVGYRGNLSKTVKQEGKYIPTVFFEKKSKHSQKPEIMYKFIENRTMGNKIELFARGKPRVGWTFWGNQI